MNLQPVQPSDSKGMPPLSTNNHGVVLVTACGSCSKDFTLAVQGGKGL